MRIKSTFSICPEVLGCGASGCCDGDALAGELVAVVVAHAPSAIAERRRTELGLIMGMSLYRKADRP